MKKVISYLIYVAIPLIVGMLSWALTSDAMEQYVNLKMPPFSPPGTVFPIVWTILFILMGTGAYIIYNTPDAGPFVTMGLITYYVQLFMNFIWSILFFRENMYMGALIWLIIMWMIVLLMLYAYMHASKLAFWLNIPLIIWLTFAMYLNIGVIALQ